MGWRAKQAAAHAFDGPRHLDAIAGLSSPFSSAWLQCRLIAAAISLFPLPNFCQRTEYNPMYVEWA